MDDAVEIPALQQGWVSWEEGRVSPLGFEGRVSGLLRYGKGTAWSGNMCSYLLLSSINFLPAHRLMWWI